MNTSIPNEILRANSLQYPMEVEIINGILSIDDLETFYIKKDIQVTQKDKESLFTILCE